MSNHGAIVLSSRNGCKCKYISEGDTVEIRRQKDYPYHLIHKSQQVEPGTYQIESVDVHGGHWTTYKINGESKDLSYMCVCIIESEANNG